MLGKTTLWLQWFFCRGMISVPWRVNLKIQNQILQHFNENQQANSHRYSISLNPRTNESSKWRHILLPIHASISYYSSVWVSECQFHNPHVEPLFVPKQHWTTSVVASMGLYTEIGQTHGIRIKMHCPAWVLPQNIKYAHTTCSRHLLSCCRRIGASILFIPKPAKACLYFTVFLMCARCSTDAHNVYPPWSHDNCGWSLWQMSITQSRW